ncbi:MAG: hypothetical protein KKF98_11270 [Bacteroidetes bacterium]|nr:hypothetical protein [Bacteroidota bacterium]
MLTTHLDKEIYIDAYQKFKPTDIINTWDFIDFLSKDTDVILYGITSDMEYESANILTKLLEGRGDQARTSTMPESFSPTKTPFNADNPYQVFFLNLNDKDDQILVTKRLRMLVGFKDNYYQVFSEFKKEPFFRVDSEVVKNKFSDWLQVLPDMPVTDIVISDPYILKSSENFPLSSNLYRLIQSIKDRYQNLDSMIIFSTIENINDLKPIKEHISRILGNKTTIVTILFGRSGEHDRHIFTNYHHVKIGSSLNSLFDKEGILNVKRRSTIKVQSYCNPEHFREAEPVLVSLNKVFEEYKSKKRLPDYLRCKLFLSNDLAFPLKTDSNSCGS